MWTCVRVECSETRSTADAIEEPNLGRDRTVLAGASGVAVLPPTPPSGRVTGTGVYAIADLLSFAGVDPDSRRQ